MPHLEKELQEPESTKLLREIAVNTHTLCVKMLGSSDPDEESPTGRLPLVEAKAESAHRRIDNANKKIDDLKVRMAYYSGAAAVVVVLIRVVFK